MSLFGEQRLQIERPRCHLEFAFGITRPIYGIAVHVEFEAVAIGVLEVERLADAVIGGAIERDLMLDEAAQGIGERWAIGIEDGDVIEAGGAGRRWFAATAFPGVEADVMMITTSGDEGRAGAVALRELKAEHAAVEGERALQIGHLQMNVADANAGMDGRTHDIAG